MSETALELIAGLRAKRVELWVEQGKLKYRAPKGSISDADFARLQALRNEVLDELSRPAASDAVEPHEPFPLTDIQSAYLLGRRAAFAWAGVGCHGYLEFHQDSALDVNRLQAAIQTLIGRHPMLRTVFSSDGTQKTLETVAPFKVDYQRSDLGFSRLVESRRQVMSHHVYDGSSWPLFGFAVSETRGKCVLHISFDLLIADFSGFALLLSELEALYDDAHAVLPHLGFSFRDYVLALSRHREGAGKARFEADKAWWLARIDTLPPRPELPLEESVPPSAAFKRSRIQLAADEWQRLQLFAKEAELTASTALLAAFCEVLGKWSRTDEFTIAVPLLDRLPLHPEVGSIVGDFTTVSLLAVSQDPTTDFSGRARLCQQQLWHDLDHRSYTGLEVVREVARRTGQSDSLFPIVFTSTIGQPMDHGGRWSFARADYGITQTPQVWLDCQVLRDRDQLVINWDFRSSAIRQDVIEAMAEAFARLLKDLARDRTVWRSSDPVSLPADQVQRRALSNATYRHIPPQLIHHALVSAARGFADRVAVVTSADAITFAQMIGAALDISVQLREAGLQANQGVAVSMPKGLQQVAAVLGVLIAGGCYVPIDAHQPAARRNAILANSGVRYAIADPAVDDWPNTVVALSAADPARRTDRAFPPQLLDNAGPSGTSPGAPAYIIYTSGSTGQPKGVVISHQAANNTLVDMVDRLAVGPEDAVLGMAHLGFDLSVFDIFGVLGSGGKLVLPDPGKLCDPSHWVALLRSHGVTLWNTVPAQALMLADYLEANPDECRDIRLRHVLLSGDWIPTDLPGRLTRLLPQAAVLSLGGATEAAIWSIHHHVTPEDAHRASIPYGKPLANQRCFVLDRAMRERPDWIPGDLYIGGAGLADGYLADEAKTAAAFRVHPARGERIYRTGDIGRYNDRGEIELLGREDLQVKILGNRIELAEIDAAAVSLDYIHAAVAVAIGGRFDRRLALAVQPRSGTTLDTGQLIGDLKKRLPDNMVPAVVQVVDALPRTQNGKINRAAIATQLAEHSRLAIGPASDDPALPQGETEGLVAQVLADVLQTGRLSRDSDFLAMGGNSLLAARAVTQLRDLVPRARPMSFDELLLTLLRERTVANLSNAIEERGKAELSERALLSLQSAGRSSDLTIVVFAIDEQERLEATHRLQSLLDNALVLSVRVADRQAFESIPPELLVDRYVDTAFDLLLERKLTGQLMLVGNADMAVAALEAGRRFRESGTQQVTVVALGEPVTADAQSRVHWQRAIEAFVPYPYVGDVVLVGQPALPGTTWEDVALGRLQRFEHAVSISAALRQLTSIGSCTR